MKHREKFFAVLFFAAVMIILNYTYSVLVDISVREEKNRYQYIAINEANYISSCLDKVIARTYTLREMLVENEGGIKFFDKVSDIVNQTIKMDTGITLRNIAIAPDGVVAKVAPLSGNESLLGFDFMDMSKAGNKEAVEAYHKSQTIVTNPFKLVQGGQGMAARTPVFINNNRSRSFWGLVTVTMDFDDVLRAFNFNNFDKMHINYCLWYSDENGRKIVLDGNATEKEMENAVSEEVNIFNLKWHLDVVPEDGWHDENMKKIARIGIFLISLLLSFVVILVCRIKKDGKLMRALAEQDNLTGCYSRHYLNSVLLDYKSGNWKHPENNYSLAIVDVDKFKQINDEFGHVAGDRALMAISQILKNSIMNKKKDKIVRFGGDEFLLFYSNANRKELRIKFHNILSEVEKIQFDDIPELKLSVSIGVAIPDYIISKTYKSMMTRADENLYKVKERGRNNYVME